MTDSTATGSRSSSTNAASNILSEKVARALQVRTDTPAMKAALDALSRLPDAGEMDSRSVRVAIERDALTQALSLQEELQTLVNTVKQLKQGVAHVSNIAHEIARVSHQNVVSPNSTANNNDDGLEEELRLATLLNEAFVEQQQAKLRAETVDQFLQKFDLDPQHAAILDTFDFSDIQQDGFVFLEALDRVYKIKRELSTQNVFSDQAQHGLGASSAIRMMESLANKQERAYEKLYHWLQQYLHLNQSIQEQQHQLDPDAMDEALSHPFVRQSLRTLHHSTPAFYSHTLEMIATSRRIEVTRRFLLALTEGHGGQAPLEMKAHDPVSYVGDMLAFCFQACSVEADNVRHIVVSVSEPEEEKEEYSVQDDQPTMTAEEMLGNATSGISRPLKSRILQVISSLARKEQDEDEDEAGFEEEEEGAIARSRVSSLYNICGLLVYYRSALLKCANKDESNPLVVAIMDCLKEGTEGFAASLRVYAAMLDSLSMVTGEAETLLAQLMLGQLVEIRTTSPGFAVHVDCPKELQPSLSLDFITSILVEAALSSCMTLDDAVTLKGCISTAKKAGLVSYQHLESLVAEKERAMIDELVEEKTAQVLEVCGLGCMATAWKNMLTDVEGMTMASQAGLTEDDVELGMKEFYSSLYAPPLPTFENIKDPVLRRLARSKICDNVVQVYSDLYNAMNSEKGGYDDLSFLGHTPEQVKTLFSA
jgi:hypothetical protein